MKKSLKVTLAALATAAALAVTIPLAVPPTEPIFAAGSPNAIENQYIVVLKDEDASAQDVNEQTETLIEEYNGEVEQTYSHSINGFVAEMSDTSAERLAAEPEVAYVEQDRWATLNQTQINPVWNLDRIDQRDRPLSKSYTYTSAADVTAYVLDSGIRTTHTQFGSRASYGPDFIDDDSTSQDCNGHGTHVAGTVGGTTYGVAKDVDIVGIRVLNCSGQGPYSDIIAGVDWVAANAATPAVANMSIGGSTSTALDDAIEDAVGAGITFVVSAGNDNVSACNQSPAREPTAITVASTTSSDVRSSFSNHGTCVDIFAPGSSVLSASYSSNTATTTKSGTSMASPHVAGAAARILQSNPSWTPTQVRDELVNTATTGKIQDARSGSPNKLLYVFETPAPPPPACDFDEVQNTTDYTLASLKTITSSVIIAGCEGNASASSEVHVNLTHEARGDLEITLIAPDGSKYLVQESDPNDKTNDIDLTYGMNLAAEPKNGTWKLQITDKYSLNDGFLEDWTLTL